METWRTGKVVTAAGVLSLWLAAIASRAWVTEDAYITFRTVDNFVNGYGLTWNVDERVQAYTHPLWMFLHVIPYAISGDIYWTSLGLSFTCCLLAMGLLLKAGRHAWSPLLFLPLLGSKAVCDYATSGLENAATWLFLAAFLHMLHEERPSLRALSLAAALSVLNRFDTLLLYLPPLALLLLERRTRSAIRDVFLGFLPFFAWEAFSLFYYGFAFPNTKYAKLSTGIAGEDYRAQGLAYAIDLVVRDPVGATLLVVGTVAVALTGWQAVVDSRHRRWFAFGLGIWVYMAYVVSVGGDFMSGRFWSTPIVASVALVAWLVDESADLLGAAGVRSLGVLGALLLVLYPRANYFNAITPTSPSGIADERYAWAETNAIEVYQRGGTVEAERQSQKGKEARLAAAQQPGKPYVIVSTTVGMLGFHAGPGVRIIDKGALADPLLARVPVEDPKRWRPGHFMRYIPRGYEDVRRTGDVAALHPQLQEYYRHLRLVVSGDLLSAERLFEIVKFNLGLYDALLDPYIAGRRQYNANLSAGEEPAKTSAGRPEASGAASSGGASSGAASSGAASSGAASSGTGVTSAPKVPGVLSPGPSFPIGDAALARPDHTPWNAAGTFQIPDGTEAAFRVEPPAFASEVEFSADAKDVYTLVFYSGEEELGRITAPKVKGPFPGLVTRTEKLPPGVGGSAITRVGVFGEGDGKYSVGHLVLR